MERRGLTRQGHSRSSPALAAAFSLRQYSLERKRCAAPTTPKGPKIVLEEVDLVGGNGRWRQRMAEDEWARRAVEEEKRLKEKQELEEARRKRRAAKEARLKRKLKEEEERHELERERQRQLQLQQEEEVRQEEIKQQHIKEEKERAWLAQQPRTCEKCGGVGKCPKCGGKGYLFTMILAPTVREGKSFESGRIMEGCMECHGYQQNLMAELKKGTGRCSGCEGFGKIAPPEEMSPSMNRSRHATMHFFSEESSKAHWVPPAPH